MLPLEFEFPFDRREWTQASRAVLFVAVRRLWWVYGVITLVFLGVAVLAILQVAMRHGPFVQAALSALPWVILLAFWGWLIYFGAPGWAAKQIERKYPAFAGQQVWVSPGSTQKYQWSAVYRVVETKRFVLLFVTMQAAQFVPKRLIAPEQLIQLRALLAEVLPADRLRLMRSAA